MNNINLDFDAFSQVLDVMMKSVSTGQAQFSISMSPVPNMNTNGTTTGQGDSIPTIYTSIMPFGMIPMNTNSTTSQKPVFGPATIESIQDSDTNSTSKSPSSSTTATTKSTSKPPPTTSNTSNTSNTSTTSPNSTTSTTSTTTQSASKPSTTTPTSTISTTTKTTTTTTATTNNNSNSKVENTNGTQMGETSTSTTSSPSSLSSSSSKSPTANNNKPNNNKTATNNVTAKTHTNNNTPTTSKTTPKTTTNTKPTSIPTTTTTTKPTKTNPSTAHLPIQTTTKGKPKLPIKNQPLVPKKTPYHIPIASTGRPKILQAILDDDTMLVIELLLENKLNTNAHDNDGNGLARYILNSHNIFLFQLLIITNYIHPNRSYAELDDDIPIHYLIRTKNHILFETLLDLNVVKRPYTTYTYTIDGKTIHNISSLYQMIATTYPNDSTTRLQFYQVLSKTTHLTARCSKITVNYSPIVYACFDGNIVEVKLLLQSGACCFTELQTPSSMLCAAIKSGNLDVVQHLCGRLNNFCYKSTKIKIKQRERPKLFFNPIQPTVLKEIPIYIAIYAHYVHIVKYFIKSGLCHPTFTDSIGQTLLHKMSYPHTLQKSTSLSTTSVYTKMDMCQYLYELLVPKYFPIDIRDNNGTTPLQLAIQYNQLELVQFLIKKNAQLDLIRYREGNLLHFIAQEVKQAEMIDYLLSITNYDINQRDMIEATPLLRAITTRNVIAVQRFLQFPTIIIQDYFDSSIDLNIRGIGSRLIAPQSSFIHFAVTTENCDLVELLLNHGIDPGKAKCPLSVFELAIQYDSLPILQSLLKFTTKYTSLNPYELYSNRTILQIAIRSLSTKCTKYLIDEYPRLITLLDKDNIRYSPLFHAIIKFDWEIFNILFEHGASLTHTTYNGNNIFHCITFHAQPEKHGDWYGAKLIIKNDGDNNTDIVGNNNTNINGDNGDDENNKTIDQKMIHNLVTTSATFFRNQLPILIPIRQLSILSDIDSLTSIDINAMNNNGLTPLHLAAQTTKCRSQLMRYLCKLKANPFILTRNNNSLIELAIKSTITSNVHTALSLMSEYIDHSNTIDDIDDYIPTKPLSNEKCAVMINRMNPKSGYAPIHLAIKTGIIPMVKRIVEYKADPLMKSGKRETIIQCAQNNDMIKYCKDLYKIQSNTTIKTNSTNNKV